VTRADSRRSFASLVQARWFAPLLLVACAVLPYVGTWSHGFVAYDDEQTIIGLPLIRTLSWQALPGFFKPVLYPGLPEYMPLKNLSYAVDYALFGLAAPGFRIQQQLWYLASVLLFWLWLRSLLRSMAAGQRLGVPATFADPIALVTAALFALHPVHVESVTWLSGRKDVLCGTFMLAALYFAWRWRAPAPNARGGATMLVGAIACTGLALLSKPMAIVLPALFALQDYVCAEPRRSVRELLRERAVLYFGSSVMAIAFAVFYRRLVPVEVPDAALEARLYTGASYARWGQQLALFVWYSIAPGKLAPYMPPGLLDPGALSPRALLGYGTLALLIIGGVIAVRRRHPLALALGLFALPLAPILISPPWAQYIAGRYLFQAVAGVLLALVWLGAYLLALRPERRSIAWLAGVLLAASLSFGTLDYNREWKDGLSLWLGALEKHPEFTVLYKLASHTAIKAGHSELALSILQRCLEVDPLDGPCNGTLGVFMLRANPAQGEALLRRALPRDESGDAHVALARYLADRGDAAQGVRLCESWLQSHPSSVPRMEELVRLALRAKQYGKAYAAVRSVVHARAQSDPGAVPPAQLLRDVAGASGSAAFHAKVEDALRRCSRVECVQHALGW
jgi:hypothetical protein